MTTTFQPGDTVRRKRDALKAGYRIGTQPFQAQEVDPTNRAVRDPEGQWHWATNLELVEAATPEPDSDLPTWTLTAVFTARDLTTAMYVAGALPMNFNPGSVPSHLLEYRIETTDADGKRRGVGFTR